MMVWSRRRRTGKESKEWRRGRMMRWRRRRGGEEGRRRSHKSFLYVVYFGR